MTELVSRNRLPLAALALLLAGTAQWALGGPRPLDGWVLYAAAAILFAATFQHDRLARAAGGRLGERVSPALSVLPRFFWTRVALSVALNVLSLLAFAQSNLDVLGWALHLSSVLLLLSTAVALRWRRGWDRARLTQWLRAWWPLALIVLVALAVRLWRNDAMPEGLWFDEAREGVVAQRILADPTYRPVYIDDIERPAHYAYLIALGFSVFGARVAALRLVPALFGALNVVAAFLLFDHWFGRASHGGLIAAALVTVMRYDITFSRIVFDANSTPFFIMLTLYFLDRGLERKQVSDFTLAGLTLGFSLAFYLPTRIFVLLLVSLGTALLAAAMRRARSWVVARAWLPHVAFAVLGVSIAISPVGEFALREPAIFFDRTQSASVFSDREESDVAQALRNSTLKHLGMFNYRGDQNGRHNLPSIPMLDPITGMLLVLGLGLVVRRWRDLPNGVMLLLFAGMLQAGIFSTDFEAPNALRSIGVVPSLVYFATLALVAFRAAVTQFCEMFSARWARPLMALVLGVALAVIAGLNLDIYFNQQMRDPIVWKAHSIAETWIAGEINRLGSTHDVILTARYTSSPTIQFLAQSAQPWFLRGNRPLVMFLDPLLWHSMDEIQRAYPTATVRQLAMPDGEPLVFEIIVNP